MWYQDRLDQIIETENKEKAEQLIEELMEDLDFSKDDLLKIAKETLSDDVHKYANELYEDLTLKEDYNYTPHIEGYYIEVTTKLDGVDAMQRYFNENEVKKLLDNMARHPEPGVEFVSAKMVVKFKANEEYDEGRQHFPSDMIGYRESNLIEDLNEARNFIGTDKREYWKISHCPNKIEEPEWLKDNQSLREFVLDDVHGIKRGIGQEKE